MFYAQSTAKGHIRAKQNVLLILGFFKSDSLFMTHSAVYDRRSLGETEMKTIASRMQIDLVAGRSPVSTLSMQGYL